MLHFKECVIDSYCYEIGKQRWNLELCSQWGKNKNIRFYNGRIETFARRSKI